jgi:hypothetical protein
MSERFAVIQPPKALRWQPRLAMLFFILGVLLKHRANLQTGPRTLQAFA